MHFTSLARLTFFVLLLSIFLNTQKRAASRTKDPHHVVQGFSVYDLFHYVNALLTSRQRASTGQVSDAHRTNQQQRISVSCCLGADLMLFGNCFLSGLGRNFGNSDLECCVTELLGHTMLPPCALQQHIFLRNCDGNQRSIRACTVYGTYCRATKPISAWEDLTGTDVIRS